MSSSLSETQISNNVVWSSVAQPPDRGPVPGPGINYTGPREA